MAGQPAQIPGSVFILIPFALARPGRRDVKVLRYRIPDTAGSGILAADAAATAQWGFLLLEGTWAVVSLVGVASRRAAVRVLTGR
jgi:hypothetical protein